MVNPADTNQTELRFKEETTYATAPGGNFDVWRMTGETLGQDTTTVDSDEIRADREMAEVIRTQVGASGDVNFELAYGSYDVQLEAALMSAAWTSPVSMAGGPNLTITLPGGVNNLTRASGNWSTDGFLVGQWIELRGMTDAANNGFWKILTVGALSLTLAGSTMVAEGPTGGATCTMGGQVVNGTTFRSFHVERAYAPISSEFAVLRGMAFQGFNMTANKEQKVVGAWNLIGKDEQSGSSSVAGTPVAAGTQKIYSVTEHLKLVQEGRGTGGDIKIQGFSLNFANGLYPLTEAGELGATGIGLGDITLDGTLQFYYRTKTLFDKYLAYTDTGFGLVFEAADGATLIFEVIQSNYSNGRRVAGTKGTAVIGNMDWKAYRNATEGKTFRVSRFAA